MTITHDVFAPSSSSKPHERLGLRQRIARRLVHRQLLGLNVGRVDFFDERDRSTTSFGTGADLELHATVRVLDGSFYTALVARGSVGVAEAWIDGAWTCDDLTTLVRIMVRNRSVLDGLEGGLAKVAQASLKLLHSRNANTRAGSRRNIAAHYDLGNDFFEQFLDSTMTYSCGVFVTPDTTLEQAQVAKLDSLCRKLDLKPGDQLLEIGTGWGSLAVHAAREYGCKVTSTTISKEQHAVALERVERAGLGDRVTLLLEDYRSLDGKFDKLVSCEMIEAVGADFLQQYLATCSSLLAPHGIMVMQAILIADQEYERALREVDFIKRYVFPGSFIPSTTAILDATTAATDLRLVGYEELGPHYATTLRHWREALCANADTVRELGYDESFLRLWEYYLCYCEGGFAERFLGVGHFSLSKPLARPDHLIA